MKIFEVDNKVKITDFENFFDVFEDQRDSRKPYFFNLNSTVYFDGVPQEKYKLAHDMFWTTISYELYKTTRLWWVLMKINNVKCENTFDIVPAATTIRYIDKETLQQILMTLKD